MAKNVLAVIDMQNDFIDGALGTKEAQAIVGNVVDCIKKYASEGAQVVYTRDTHFDNYMETQEGKNLPVPHCIKGTAGWEIREELKSLQKDDTRIFDKLTFGSVELAEYLKGIEGIESVTLIGLCTDICVISNAMVIKANLPEVQIKVVESCCAGVTPQSHKNALEAMKMCQIAVV